MGATWCAVYSSGITPARKGKGRKIEKRRVKTSDIDGGLETCPNSANSSQATVITALLLKSYFCKLASDVSRGKPLLSDKWDGLPRGGTK